ncbi:DUF4296 domain-containing protein [Tenacibaculum insulae]|uniref:DUF4296 domain-containing protein n=1 Tax=Tenacibaculum insulae TaxID=2029677 RepID=UPI003AB2676B
MKKVCYILVFIICTSCTTSNTIYKKPKNLIPKDSMVALLTDMYIASSAKSFKNKFLKKEKNYVFLVYKKYKIDSTRFNESNMYYTSIAEDYTEMLKEIKLNIDSLEVFYKKKQSIKDSITKMKKSKGKKTPLKLLEKNEKLLKSKKSIKKKNSRKLD